MLSSVVGDATVNSCASGDPDAEFVAPPGISEMLLVSGAFVTYELKSGFPGNTVRVAFAAPTESKADNPTATPKIFIVRFL
jgi:hypothetical protein